MKNKFKAIMAITAVLALAVTPVFSDGIGFYDEPYTGYVTEEGTPYSNEEMQAASSIYPVGTILQIASAEGEMEMVYVNDYFSGLPDRTILLNRFAAEQLGILETGYAEREVSVLSESDIDRVHTGWYSYKVASYKTNQEAYDAILLLEHNNFKSTAKRTDSGCDVYIRYITAYQAEDMEKKLEELGFFEYEQVVEHNPYL